MVAVQMEQGKIPNENNTTHTEEQEKSIKKVPILLLEITFLHTYLFNSIIQMKKAFSNSKMILYFQNKEPEKNCGICGCVSISIFLAIIFGSVYLVSWGIDEITGVTANRERLRLQELHEHEEKLLEQ